MKEIIQLASLIALTAILGGCAGYNTAMFMTKSNAGLDIDTKPPTAEINISRKEAVIEPSFEKGQTPPVMASFKPRVGWGGGFTDYFLGVDQTFVGGDAAFTMASLYDSPTPSTDVKYDSTLTVSKKIKKHSWPWSWLFDPADPDEVRPFIFGTDTQLGLKVAWSGAGGQFPDTVKAGFNRKEFAWAPITVSDCGTKVKMPSFLATIQSHIGGGSSTNWSSTTNQMTGTSSPNGEANAITSTMSMTAVTNTSSDSMQGGGISSIQYFATGEAARLLAQQKDVRDAMLKRLDPTYSSSVTGFGKGIVALQLLSAMEDTLRLLTNSDPAAKVFYEKIENLQSVKIPDTFKAAAPPIVYYATGNETNEFKAFTTDPPIPAIHSPNKPITLRNAATYMGDLNSSMEVIKKIKAQLACNTNGVLLSVDYSTNKISIVQTNSFEIGQQFQIQAREYDRVQNEMAVDKDIKSAYDYYRDLVNQ